MRNDESRATLHELLERAHHLGLRDAIEKSTELEKDEMKKENSYGSRAEVTSSSKRTRGCLRKTLAMQTRCF